MAAKKLSAQQVRDRRAKIMLAVLGVVFVGVLALELPKVMGHSGGGAPAAAAPATTTPATGATTATPAATPALASAPSQLTHFSRFAAKDPFRAQAGGVKSQAGGSAPAAPQPATPKPSKPKQAPPPLTISVSQQPAPSMGPRVPAALLLINGKKHVIALNAGFPKKQPIFRVVALSQNAIWIQLVGGSLGNGQQTIKLQKGRHVTLANTTIGLKLALALVKPTTAPAPPPSATPAPATTTATPAPTTPVAPATPTTPATTTTG